MSQDDKPVVVPPDDRLSRRTRGAGGITPAQAAQRAHQGVRRMADDYPQKLESDLAWLAGAIARDRPANAPAGNAEVRAPALEIKALAATFGCGLAGRIAASLVRYLEYVPAGDGKRREVLASHLAALRWVVDRRLGDRDAEAEAMIAELERAVTQRRDALG
jgi:hypothetical protein